MLNVTIDSLFALEFNSIEFNFSFSWTTMIQYNDRFSLCIRTAQFQRKLNDFSEMREKVE